MERNSNQISQKEIEIKIDNKPLLFRETEQKNEIDLQPIEKILNNPQGPGGRVLRGPFGVY